ncbi:MAG: nuclear transport factor 2 family protein [Gammaproteobacteria bacterium]|nr:nuclear transport factor 2 family protein [Gammaproteobacteria bacterium]
MSMSTKEVIEKLKTAVSARNADDVSKLLAEDVIFTDPMGKTEGRENVHQMFKGWFGMVTNIKWDVRKIIVDGENAAIERVNHLSLENGKEIVLPITGVFHIVNGKIKSGTDYFNLKSFEQQISGN